MKTNLSILTILLAVIIMTGCAPRYSCKEMIPGTRCASLSEVYDEQVIGLKIPKDKKIVASEEKAAQKKQNKVEHKTALFVASAEKTGQLREPNNIEIVKGLKSSGQMPILRPPKIVRIWIAPWVDGNDDLNMDTYIYTEIREKKWILGEDIPSNTSAENIGRIYDALE